MKKINLALDWTPNINHLGFFIAQEKGYYEENQLEVHITDPSQDDYSQTPAKKVELGIADFALCPTESLISYQTKPKPFKLIAVATILQKELSAIVVRADSQISRPSQLDDKSYASYQARYEDEIVREMIINDGGKGEISLHYPKKLGIWDTLVQGQFDSTWIFDNWEGVEARQKGLMLNYFKLEDYGIPYSYSPVLVADELTCRNREADFKAFLKATKRGFLFAQRQQEEAVTILKKYLPEKDQSLDLTASLRETAGAFGGAEDWGKIDEARIKDFLDWIYKRQLESVRLQPSDLYTQALLPDR
ncbi:ABC transporter substrate-binding protein [Algoriphagus namhaensis]